MATKLLSQSFADINIQGRTSLAADYVSGSSPHVESTQGFNDGDIVYVGELSREGCEKAVVSDVPDATTLTLTSPLQTPHSASDVVTSVLGDLVHIYRAANVDGSVPADELFTVLATRDIDPEQLPTYCTDNSASSA